MKMFRRLLAVTLAALLTAALAVTAYASPLQGGETPSQVSVVRLGGKDRFETANLIADEGWKSADTVFLANSNSYADALAGTPLAYAYSAPILLTDGKKLSDPVKAEIKKLGAKNVYLLGGEAAISDSVAKDLKETYTVTRIWGQTRYETALKIAEALEAKGQAPADIFIASGVNYPDALSASSAAAIKHAPILYAPADGKLDKASTDFIAKCKPYCVYILGGKAAVGEAAEDAAKKAGAQSVSRLGGADRYETSAKIAEQFDPQFKSDHAAFATGKNFPDALAGSVLAAKYSMPVLLTDSAKMNDSVKKYFDGRNRDKVYVFGGSAVIPDSIIDSYIGSVSPDTDLDKYVGIYECGKCTVTVKKTGTKNGLGFDVRWDTEAFIHEEWNMSGVLDEKTGKTDYSDAKRTNHVFYDSTGKDNVKTVYTNGTGSFVFNSDGSLTWSNSDKDLPAGDMKFVNYSAMPEIDLSKYVGTYSNDKCTVEVKKTENKNELSFVVSWNTKEMTHEEWIMSGVMTDDSGKVAYYNAERSNHVLFDAIGQDNITPVYNNGKGSFEFGSDGSLTWNNDWNGLDKDLPANNMKFVKPSPLPDVDLSKLTGRYGYSRCTIDVSESGEKNGLKFSIYWSNSAADNYTWTMSGIVDPATPSRVNYSDSVKTYHKFDETGKEIETKVEYNDGAGRFQFGDGYLLWQDELESKDNEELGQTKFVRSGEIPSRSKEDIVKSVVTEMYKINYGKVVEEVKFNNVKVYTSEEIAADPALKDYKLGDKDIVFEVAYELKIIDGYENIIAFTAGTGEIKGSWVVEKYNVGIAKYVSDGEYTVDNFGTGF